MKTLLLILALTTLVSALGFGQTGWLPQTSPVSTSLGKVQFMSATEGWITTDDGLILHTTNAGSNWSIQDPEPTDYVQFIGTPCVAMSFISATTGWVAGTIGGLSSPSGAVLYKTTNGGTSWTRQNLSSWIYAVQVQFVNANVGWVTVANGIITNLSGAIIHTTDGGVTWSTGLTLTNRVPFCQFLDANNGWAIVDSLGMNGLQTPAEVLHTTNGGVTWTSQLYDATLGFFSALHFTNLSNGWFTGDSGKIYKTTNGGAQWTKITNAGQPSDAKHNTVFFIDANNGWIGSSPDMQQNEVLHTTNGGASWTRRASGTQYAVFSIFFFDANNGWLAADFGEISHTTNAGDPTSVSDKGDAPKRFALEQNYPNPFNPSTTIRFDVPTRSFVSIKIFDLLGREIETLTNGYRDIGTYAIKWNPEQLPNGPYFYRLTAGNFSTVHKMMLLK